MTNSMFGMVVRWVKINFDLVNVKQHIIALEKAYDFNDIQTCYIKDKRCQSNDLSVMDGMKKDLRCYL